MAPGCDLTRYVSAYRNRLLYADNRYSAFNNATFSDVTIRFSGREIKCHKLVLSLASDYFKALLDPDKAFAESKQAVVELQDDDPDAVETMLRHIYDFSYQTSKKTAMGLRERICVFNVAQKYLVTGLETQAYSEIGLHRHRV